MWLIRVIAILLLQANYCRSTRRCCPEGTELMGGANCTDGTKVLLNCSGGMYELNPRVHPVEDNFTIVEEELEIAGSFARTESHRFCVGTDGEFTRALICFDDEVVVEAATPWLSILMGTLGAISALFLYATLLVYTVLPELRDLQGKILMSAMSSLLGAYVILATIQLNTKISTYHDTTCKTLAFSMYYLFMAAFIWLNLVALNVWRSVWFTTTVTNEEALYWIYSLVGWGAPVIFLVIAVMGDQGVGSILNPNFGTIKCWFPGPHETWVYLYGPVACLMTLNILYFALTCYELWHKYRGFRGTKLRILRFKCLLYLKLFWVMGVTWIFEVISFATGPDWTHYWILTDILNGLQGLIIFVLLVVMRKRVRKLLAKKSPFGINFPKSWAAGDDEESEVPVADEELELSQAG